MITIIDYKAGNPRSVRYALDAIGVPNRLVSDPEIVRKSDKILFPGVGAARSAMQTLREFELTDALRERVDAGVPFLGICLGMQILLDESEEDGGTGMLGIVHGKVKRFSPEDHREKVPQIGWNDVDFTREHPVFERLESGGCFYFVHSYYAEPSIPETIFGTTDYAGVKFASIIGRKNLIATQFHPEKSGPLGLTLLRNFANWDGC